LRTAANPEDYSRLYTALDRLPEKHRVPLALYYLDGEDSKSVARELDISENGVHTRLSRARRALRKLLADEEGMS
jgi:RNA polymerase sigma factor (sigma-70 family)